MRSTLLLSLFAIGLGACIVGCGDHGVPPSRDMATTPDDLSAVADMTGVIPEDAKVIVTFTMFAQDYAQAVCAHAMACGQLDAAQLNACIERNVLHSGWDQDVEIMKGRMVINELQCLNAIQKSSCDSSDLLAVSAECKAFLYTGNQAAGAPCIANAECQKNLYCQHAGSDAGMPEQVSGCPGVCATVKMPGQTCRIGTDCATDSYCAPTGTPGVRQCKQLSALHANCSNVFGVGTGQPCQYGLFCSTFASAPTCEIPSTQTMLGGACDPYQGAASPSPACGTGMYCQVQYTATTTACTGAPNDCGAVVGGYCNVASGFCQKPTSGKCATKIAAGTDCDPNNESFFSFAESQCVDGAICAQYTGQTKPSCQAFRAANASCRFDEDCKIGFYCDPTGLTCKPWLADHASCNNTTAQFCTSEICIAQNADAGGAMTCEAPKGFGASCLPGFEDAACAPADLVGSSQCAANAGAGGTCAPKCF